MALPRMALFRNRIRPYAKAKLGLLTHALNYGTGVFAGIRGYWNQKEKKLYVFRLADHVRRLHESARLLRMDLPLSEKATAAALLKLLRAEGLREDCYIRALAFYSDEVIGVRLHGLKPVLAAVAVPFGLYIDKAEGAHCTVSSWRRPDDNVIPPRGKITGSYANSALAKSDAELAGFDEAILLNCDGHVSEGSGENIFLIRRGIAVTPSLDESVLEGITRRSLITLLREELGLTVEERPVERGELYLADEIFLTGTAAQITAVTRIDHRPIGSGQMGPVTKRLRSLFFNVVRGRSPKYRPWCTPVA
ncbi:MAG TPA: branched-chain amino acid transaminase [Polyangia bacterium]|nr:branched-chain amino acid transaminase [Polyangia bacterium]